MIRLLGRCCILLVLAVLVGLASDLLVKGMPQLGHLGREVVASVVNTVWIVAGALLLAVGPALATALWLGEPLLSVPGGWRAARRLAPLVDVGVGLPRVAWGLFGYGIFGGVLGLGYSALNGVLTLACLLAPILISGFTFGLHAVPYALREQCAALGLRPWTAVWTQILPAAAPAVRATLALALGRGLGDAAALLLTAGVATRALTSPLDPAATLAVHVHHLLTAVPGGRPAAYAAALVLFALATIVHGLVQWQPRSHRA